MELLALLAVAVIIGVPIIATVALVRAANVRQLAEEQHSDAMSAVSDLKREIVTLRAAIAQVVKKVEAVETRQAAPLNTSPTASAVESPNPTSTSKPVEVSFTPAVSSPANAETSSTPRQPLTRQASPQPVHVSIPIEEADARSTSQPPPPQQSSAEQQGLAAQRPSPAFIPEPRPAYIPGLTQTHESQRQEPQPQKGQPERVSLFSRLRTTLPLEELLGTNLFAKAGMTLLVLGFALLGRVALVAMGPLGKVCLILAASVALLGSGVWLERNERYRLVGRTAIGGGWALLFFTTYAMYHVAAMQILRSETLDCVLLLCVAIAMVVHTLRYRSQLVTGLAFLLAFLTVALSQDTVYALSAGVILALGIVVIALRMGWYEIEVFGILASYSNHFYWLYKLYPKGFANHTFPQFWASGILLILYWLTFRISYVVRKISTPHDETISAIAALLNTTLLLAVMKFQSTRPELAFYALLALGAAEFAFGQLPIVRRRRAAFILLTVLGTALMLAAVPFKFSGNNIALLWMIAAEVLVVAGIAQSELVFRRLGLLIGMLTGFLVLYEATAIIQLRATSERPLNQTGVLLLTSGTFFFLNSHFVCRKWRSLFDNPANRIDGKLAITHSYFGAITAFLGAWALFTHDWTAIAWAVLAVALAFASRQLKDRHLLIESCALAMAALLRAALVNSHLDQIHPHHPMGRLIALPLLALIYYALAWLFNGVEYLRTQLRTLALWGATLLLAAIARLDVAPAWVAVVWMTLAIALLAVGRRIRLSVFSYQEHALALLVALQLFFVNLHTAGATARYIPFIFCTASLYALSRLCTLPYRTDDPLYDPANRQTVAWAHTWIATALLASLAWYQSPQLWLAALWALFALALALVNRWLARWIELEEMPYQAHTLAALAVLRTATLNLYSLEKWRGIDLRLITVAIVVIAFYALARWVRIPQALRWREVHHLYTWVGSLLTAWLLWSELRAIAVAPALAVFGVLLFEWGSIQRQRQLRLQAYLALAAAFVRIFLVNLTAARFPGERLSPAISTVIPIILIDLYVWSRLQSISQFDLNSDTGRFPICDVLAYFGSGGMAALLYFQISQAWIIVAWSLLALALLASALLLDKAIFQQQATLLVIGIVARGIAHNIYGGSYFITAGWHGSLTPLSITACLLFAALPIAFRLKARALTSPPSNKPGRLRAAYRLALQHPEQFFFFAPITLITLMISVKMNPGMVTLVWGLEGVLVILLGLAVNQRTYRITGLLLLSLCIGKIVLRDAWRLSERDRYITFIVLGTSLTLVSLLYNKYRESLRRLL